MAQQPRCSLRLGSYHLNLSHQSLANNCLKVELSQTLMMLILIFELTLTGFVDEDSPYASNGKKGTYYFEFSRPLRTMDRFQQVFPLFLLSLFLIRF